MPDARQLKRDSEIRATQRTLESTYCPPLIAEARERQDALLLERLRGGSYRIADIGCGNGYHAMLLAPVGELYHGFEISTELAEKARSSWLRAGITHADIFLGDVAEAELLDRFYDLALCLYFTPGNFRDRSSDLSLYTDAYLDRNPQFIRVMSRFYAALRPGGRMFLTVYRDVPEAEASQIDFYEKTGQHPITPRGSRFVATQEGFWSARWTRESVLSNLGAFGVEPERVSFHELNRIAWMVEVRKPEAANEKGTT